MDLNQFYVIRLSEHATVPKRCSNLAAGYDLFSAEDIHIPSGETKLVRTDLEFILPDGCYARIAPKSGLALKNWIMVNAGVIDRDYEGPVGVVLHNLLEGFTIKKGDKIAQVILEMYKTSDPIDLTHCSNRLVVNLLRDRKKEMARLEGKDVGVERGTGGFGSTGV
jgi:dUTP pyrophosphatase